MLSHVDMRPYALLACIVLIAGTLYVMHVARRGRRTTAARWIPWVSLLVGPIFGILFWSLEVFVINPREYSRMSDSWSVLGPILFVCSFAGCLAAFVFGIALYVWHRRHIIHDEKTRG